jgi:serine/threonine protein kinase
MGEEPVPGYRLTRPLGAGAFGEVWEARDRDGGVVAMKFLDARSLSMSMIRNEIRVLRGLNELRHPHIIPLLGVHASSRYLILILERADGNLHDLRQAYLDETGANMPSDDALDLIQQAARALDFLTTVKIPGVNEASRGLQHCDVKPSNLLLVGETLKVADFGLCVSTSWNSTRGRWRGTPPYAAPELYDNHGVPGSDQYALAVTYCELVFGQRVFVERSNRHAPPSGLPIDLSQVRNSEVSVLSRALHPHPSSRWPTCLAFVEALRKAHNNSRQLRRVPQTAR